MDWISYMPALTALAAVAAVLVAALARSARAGFLLLVGAYVLDSWLAGAPVSLGVLVYPQDIVLTVLLLAAGMRYLLRSGGERRGPAIPLLLMGLFALSLSRGIGLYGAKAAGVECRPEFYFLAGLLYFSSFHYNPRQQKQILDLWLAASGVLLALALERWTLGLEALRAPDEGGLSELRVLNASQTMFLAFGFFASLFLNLSRRGPRWQRMLFYALGPAIVLLQHRTVWAVTIVGLLWLAGQRVRLRTQFLRAAIAMAAVAALWLVLVSGRATEIATASLQQSATDEGTLRWRLEGWRQLMLESQARNLFSGLVGQPFGAGFERTFEDVLVDSAPHNYYVEAFLRLGLAGLLLLFSLYLPAIRYLKRLPAPGRVFAYPDTRFWSMVLVAQLVFFVTYSPGYEQSVLTGIAVALRPLEYPGKTAEVWALEGV